MDQSRPFSEHPKPFSATSGCMIPIIIVTVLAVLATWAAYSFWKQNKAISAFTVDEPLALEPIAVNPASLDDLRQRLADFGAAALAAGSARLELDADALNALIATEPPLEGLRPLVRVESIRDGHVHCRISFPMRTLGPSGMRHLNGRLSFVPKVNDGILFLDLASMESDAGVVDAGFISGYRHNRYLDSLFLRPYEEESTVGRVVKRITSASVEGDRVVVESKHDSPAPPPQ